MSIEYAFTANAVALGGVITKPQRSFIPSQASVVLSPTGGFGSATVTNFNYQNFITFDEARTDALGVMDGSRIYVARTRMSITNLNIGGVLHADYMEAVVTSRRNLADPMERESKFKFEVRYEGLQINDEDVAPHLNDTMCFDHPSFDVLEREGMRQLTLPAADLEVLHEASLARVRPNKEVTGEVRSSLVQSIHANGAGRVAGFSRDVNGFGKVSLGELLAKNGRRRVSMLRIDLGAITPPQADVRRPRREILAKVLADGETSTGREGSIGVLCQDGNGTEITPGP